MSNIINIEEKKKQKAVFNTRDAVESSIDLSKKDKTLTWVAQAWQRKQQEREQLKQAQEAQQRKEIQAFNAALNIPVRWFPEIKHRLGGLMENSAGNGTCKNSVVHIYLLEGLHDGRLHRNARDFLCTQPEGHHFSELISLESEPWNFENLQVTCQQCLKIAKRWQQNNPLAADRKGRAKKLVAEPQGLFAPALPGC